MRDDLTTSRILVETNAVAVDLPQGAVRLPLQSLPSQYADWLEAGRRHLYESLAGQTHSVRFFSQHLPVLVTQTEGRVFPFNCCHKGVGLIPKAEYLSEFIELFRSTLAKTENQPWQESLQQRIQAVSKFYFDREKIDYRAMSTLEIFQRQTLQNLRRIPLAGLLFCGDGPDYVSFQLNCAVEILEPDEPRHTFVVLARSLFEHDSFHLTQRHFPHAYIFWISEVIDKTPFRVATTPERSTPPVPADGLRWDEEAWLAFQHAPAMIQTHIREQIENYARCKGVTEINLRLVQQAKEELM